VLGLRGTIYEGRAWEIDRMVAAPDRAGEFKTPAESVAQSTTKILAASAAEKRSARKAAGTEIIVPGIHRDFEMPAAATLLPRKKITTNPELLAAMGSDVIPPSMVDGRLISYFNAATLLQKEETLSTPLTPLDQSWLRGVFNGREEILDTELRAAVESRSCMTIAEEGVA
jgi:hypothetical protein